ncbi:hypothetical protein HX773_24910, partial [Pantoea sp. B9002]|uniref:Ig-like domain-containing protein n=1 Tax=Pantoea sp. B9002 TaxID=2726979 RepID=UPI0015A07AA8
RNPVIDYAADNVGSVRDPLGNGDTTDDTTPTLHGTAAANSAFTLRYRLDSGSWTSVSLTANSSGNWSWTPPTLQNGNWTFEVQKAGQTGWDSLELIIDSTSDRNPVISYAADNVGSVRDNLSSGSTTDDTTPTLHGTAAANSEFSLRYRLESGSWRTVKLTSDDSGNWSWTPPTLQNGNWTFEVQKAGQTGWNGMALTIDTTSDRTPLIEYATDNVGSVQDNLFSGDTTDDNTPTLRGSAAANSEFSLRYRLESGSWTTVKVNSQPNGDWGWTPPALQNGKWTFQVQKAGQSNWDNMVLVIDTESERSPVIDYAADNVGSKQDNVFSGGTTDDTTPTLHGTTANNGMVYLKAVNGTDSQVFSFKADDAGKWQWTPSSNLALGDWSFQVSKASGSGFGNAFDLKIGKSNNYSDTLDFESLPNNIPDIFVANTLYQYSDAVKIKAISSYATVPVVSTEFVNDSSFGEKAISLEQRYDAIVISFDTKDYDAHLAVSFSFQVYNASTRAMKFSFIFGQRQTDVDLQPGVNTITSDMYSYYDNITSSELYIYNNYGGRFLVDNISWQTKFDSEKESTFDIQNNNSPDIIGADEINNTSSFGNENHIDPLQLTGKDQILDLTALSSKIESVEIFDITGTGDNTLKLDLNTLLQHGEKDLFIEDGKTQLVVNGNEGDVVQLVDILPEGSDISEWQHQEGTVTVAGVEYNVYSHDDAELLVQQGVKTELI